MFSRSSYKHILSVIKIRSLLGIESYIEFIVNIENVEDIYFNIPDVY